MMRFPKPQAAELVLGGARSGKSSYALHAALQHAGPVCWIATAQAWDAEMSARIARHQAERPPHWQTLEAPQQLAAAIAQTAQNGALVVVDCLTLWLTNCLLDPDAQVWPRERDALLAQLPALQGRLLLVSNEVGGGIVPDNALARQFRDEAGWLHQAIGSLVPDVTLVQAGLPLPLKRAGEACWA